MLELRGDWWQLGSVFICFTVFHYLQYLLLALYHYYQMRASRMIHSSHFKVTSVCCFFVFFCLYCTFKFHQLGSHVVMLPKLMICSKTQVSSAQACWHAATPSSPLDVKKYFAKERRKKRTRVYIQTSGPQHRYVLLRLIMIWKWRCNDQQICPFQFWGKLFLRVLFNYKIKSNWLRIKIE